jgi:hypothetical protein
MEQTAIDTRGGRVRAGFPGVLAKKTAKVDDRDARAGLPGSRAKRGDPVKCGARVALGVAGGYFLGRTKKVKFALALAGMAAGRRAGGPGQLLAQGTKLLGQSPEVALLTDEIRGRLLDAGKGAAVAIATRQVEALTERVVSRAGNLTEAGGKTVGGVGETVGDVGKTVGGLGRRESRDDVEYDDEYDESVDEPTRESDEDTDQDPPGEPGDTEGEDGAAPASADEDEAPPPRRRPARAGAGGKGTAEGAAKGAGGTARLAGKAAAGRAGRPPRVRQGRSDG